MQQSTNYNFNLPEGTDLVNLLTQLIPNWNSLDSILRGIQNDTFETVTETVALGVHALTRLDTNAKLIKWVATANYTAGETFTVDGTPITASTPSGNTLATGAYVSGAIVIAAINSDETAMTVFVTGTNVASDSERLGGKLPTYYATASDLSDAQTDITDLDNLMGNTSISAIGDGTVTGAISSVNNDVEELRRNGTMPALDYANAHAITQTSYTPSVDGYLDLCFGSWYTESCTVDGEDVVGTAAGSTNSSISKFLPIKAGSVINSTALNNSRMNRCIFYPIASA